ncbi:MAG: methyltransferase [Parahaliea sp.]
MHADGSYTFCSAATELALKRYPARPRETLKPWCSADQLLIEAAATTEYERLVVNDEHGVLALALSAQYSWSDSALSQIALRDNARRNRLPEAGFIFSTAPPPPTGVVIVRVPKQLDYFEYQLARLSVSQAGGTLLLAGGMDKHLSPHTADLIEHYIGPVERHRGRHKARIFSATFSGQKAPIPAASHYYCKALGATLQAQANVFGKDRLDGGSELLLNQLRHLPPVEHLVDLACGSGVLGLAALKANLCRSLLFCDESAMALASACDNVKNLEPTRFKQCHFHLGDGLRNWQGPMAELILCNPPFHLQHTVDAFVGRRLLKQAAQQLSPEGHLCVVANSHLRYQDVLKRYFHKTDQLARNKRFTVWLAHRPINH